MSEVFADSVYWIAIVRPRDQWKSTALAAKQALGDVIIITTDEVLSEFLAAFSKSGPRLRAAAVRMVRRILVNPQVSVIPQSRAGFLAGLDRYGQRADKHYSLTDCTSMNLMEDRGIDEILTNDHHFEQEGFQILIHPSS